MVKHSVVTRKIVVRFHEGERILGVTWLENLDGEALTLTEHWLFMTSLVLLSVNQFLKCKNVLNVGLQKDEKLEL